MLVTGLHQLARFFYCTLSCLLLMACSIASAHDRDTEPSSEYKLPGFCLESGAAPHSIAGLNINLQIENTVTQLASGYPTQGVVVMHYKSDGSWTAQGFGGENQQAYVGTYKYQRTGFNTAVEKSFDQTLQAPYTTSFTFLTTTSGKWVQDFNNGQITFSGSFTTVPSNLPAEKHKAPESIAGQIVGLFIKSATSAVLPPDVYPKHGLAAQIYAGDGTMVIKGFGLNTLNSTGTYRYQKVSANTAVEETIQVSDLFTLPYTMVYTFDTPTSGTWYQNLGNGFIKFTGTFETTPN